MPLIFNCYQLLSLPLYFFILFQRQPLTSSPDSMRLTEPACSFSSCLILSFYCCFPRRSGEPPRAPQFTPSINVLLQSSPLPRCFAPGCISSFGVAFLQHLTWGDTPPRHPCAHMSRVYSRLRWPLSSHCRVISSFEAHHILFTFT